MAGQCVFVLFIILNTIFGLAGLTSIGVGIWITVQKGETFNTGALSLLVIGSYITIVFIVGSCSWKKKNVLIGYFVLIIIVIITTMTLAILVAVLDYFDYLKEIRNTIVIVFGIAAGFSFLCFLLSAIYFCRDRKFKDNNLYSVVRDLEYTNLHQV